MSSRLGSLQRSTVVTAALAALVVALYAAAPPAYADSGSGDGEGYFKFDSSGISADPPCGEFTAMAYEGEFVGTVADDGSGESYTGPLTIEFTDDNETWYANPNGTFPENPSDPCGGSPGHKVNITGVSIRGGLGDETTGSVTCDGGAGQFWRVNEDGTSEFSAQNCFVNGEQAETVDMTVDHVFAGSCFRDEVLPPFPPTDCVTADSYQVTS